MNQEIDRHTTGRLPDGYTLHRRLPTLDEYRELCLAVGWKNQDFTVADRALAASLASAVIEHGTHAVATARVIGDGAIYFYVQDVIVHPDHQRRGLASAMLDDLTAQIQPLTGERAFLGLFATPAGRTLYLA